MASFSVAGQVQVQGNQATLTLSLPSAEPEVKMTRPTPDGILAKINAGKLQVHPNRMPMTTQKIIHAMGNVERALLLPGGAGGGWDPRADSRPAALLAKPIIFKKPRQEPLAIADARSAIEDNQLAIEDKDPANEEKEPNSSDESSSDSSSSDSSSSENAMDVSSFEARLQQKDAQLSEQSQRGIRIHLLGLVLLPDRTRGGKGRDRSKECADFLLAGAACSAPGANRLRGRHDD